MSSGMHTGTRGPYTLLSHIMSCRDETQAQFDQPLIYIFYFDFRCGPPVMIFHLE